MRAFARGGGLFCAAALAAAGCGSWSNEDLRFLAVLPDDALVLETPAPEAGQALYASASQALDGRGVRALQQARDTTLQINAGVRDVLSHLAELARTTPPSERDEGRRVWGPLRAPRGGFARLVMTRAAGTADDYRWWIDLGPSRLGPWDRVVDAQVRGESFDESAGHVRFDFDVAQAHGRVLGPLDPRSVTVRWAREQGDWTERITIDARGQGEGALAGGLDFLYRRRADGGGTFAFARFVRFEGQVEPSEAGLLLRWQPDGAGRADFRVRAPALPRPVVGSACWNARREVSYAEDDGALFPQAPGDPRALCPPGLDARAELPW